MITGDIKKIDLGTSSFERIIRDGCLYIDKSKFIEDFLTDTNQVNLIARQRRLGKSLNMDMLRCFLTDKKDFRSLFKGLYIEKSSVWKKAYSAPVFYFNFKRLRANAYKEEVLSQIETAIDNYVSLDKISKSSKRRYKNLTENPEIYLEDGLLLLTDIVFETIGKRSYVLIDEYDKLLMDEYNTPKYPEIKKFITALFSSVFKDNPNLEKGLLTGVMRISYESIFSDLNNIETFDVFNDAVFVDDYGLTEKEIDKLNELIPFDKKELRQWYNGVKIDGMPIYNMYSVVSFFKHNIYKCYWGKSGTMDIIRKLLTPEKIIVLERLLNGETAKVAVGEKLSLEYLNESEAAFYSLLVQSGYLAIESDKTTVSIPNKELQIVWKDFIFESIYKSSSKLTNLFNNESNITTFVHDLEDCLSFALSYYEIGNLEKWMFTNKIDESVYHVFMLGLLYFYQEDNFQKISSNRESGFGRYDIFLIRKKQTFIFEFKSCEKIEELDKGADIALNQIDEKKYFAQIDKTKPLMHVGISFCGKECRVKAKWYSKRWE